MILDSKIAVGFNQCANASNEMNGMKSLEDIDAKK